MSNTFRWFKSSYSASGGNCIEVAFERATVADDGNSHPRELPPSPPMPP
ncbi:DUF397 domain-containing protein [Streptomyces sp. ML-6]|nr:DUF397 domain-containing protein [Streptomyces sp. ML-6]MDK0520485.1 DUF397 domain-containing protein [Streptomyces sp. ML-6]